MTTCSYKNFYLKATVSFSTQSVLYCPCPIVLSADENEVDNPNEFLITTEWQKQQDGSENKMKRQQKART